MIRFLKKKQLDSALSRLVTPRRAYKTRRIVGIRQHNLDAFFEDLDDVSLLVSEAEKDGKRVPVLLRQYLKLDGRLLCFNVDRDFSDVVDGLLLVDPRYTEPRLMKRFMGEEGCRRFYALHGPARVRRPAAETPAKWCETAA